MHTAEPPPQGDSLRFRIAATADFYEKVQPLGEKPDNVEIRVSMQRLFSPDAFVKILHIDVESGSNLSEKSDCCALPSRPQRSLV